MQISFSTAAATDSGALVVGVGDGGVLSKEAERLDQATNGALKRALNSGRFKGQGGQSIEVLAPAGVPWSRIILAGLGKGEKFDGAAVERLAANIAGRLLASGEETLTFALEAPKRAKVGEPELSTHLALGAQLRSYRFDHYRKVSDDEKPTLKSVVVATKAAAAARRGWLEVSAVADGIF